jgi:hypothetical protein
MTKSQALILTLMAVLLTLSLWSLNAKPLSGDQTEKTTMAIATDSASNLWLHVEVETSWGWFWQKSKGLAYVTVGKNGPQRHAVGKLCVQLQAHDTQDKCLTDADSLVITESRKGLGIPKRTAYVTAWTEAPALDTTRVEIRP